MKSTEGRIGRVFMLRLEDGDVVPECLERFAAEKGIGTGQVVLIGGIGGGEVVVGPRRSDIRPPDAMLLPLDGAETSRLAPRLVYHEASPSSSWAPTVMV